MWASSVLDSGHGTGVKGGFRISKQQPSRLHAAGAFLFACFLVLSSFSPALAQELPSDHCLHGCPSGSPATNMVIIREIYILSNNGTTKFADWVAYKVTAETIGPSQRRKWKADPLLAENETLEPADYKDAHKVLKTDRGHQVPCGRPGSMGSGRLAPSHLQSRV